MRSLFPEVKQQSSASADLLKKTVKYMDKNWSKGITLKQKAYYAMTLNRNGYQKTARSIVESIRQFAIVKPSLGMYWDNLQSGSWWEYDKVAYTSTILRAMNEVDPRQEEIDQIRKWMLLMKQSNDWGSYSLAADAVYSILGHFSPALPLTFGRMAFRYPCEQEASPMMATVAARQRKIRFISLSFI